MRRFIGSIDAKVDAKGRVFVPAVFRKILQEMGDERLILRKDVFQDCLVLYPASGWNHELNRLRSKLNRWDERQQMIYRQFVLDSETLILDANGRILLPKRYMQATGILLEVKFVGMDDSIEVWCRAKLDELVLSPEEFKDELKQILEEPD